MASLRTWIFAVLTVLVLCLAGLAVVRGSDRPSAQTCQDYPAHGSSCYDLMNTGGLKK